jgi:hypothetical protein
VLDSPGFSLWSHSTHTSHICMFLVLELSISVYWSSPYKLGTPVVNELEFGCKNKFHQKASQVKLNKVWRPANTIFVECGLT